ncbi:FAD-binding oxidoreductase [Flavobacteriales bacterium]|nr:FAD-binding oxidoreductase [Flavobacteriales bacterium]
MSKFHALTIKDITKITSESVSITFEVPQNLQNEFVFKEGQYITLKQMINNENIQRAYSIWKAPYENELSVLVKKVENGIFSTYANESLKAGDVLEVMTPQGNFVPSLSENNSNHYTLFAAGSGITPIYSILKQILNTESQSSIDLFYVNKTQETSAFINEIEALRNSNAARLNVYNLFTKQSSEDSNFDGRINKEKLELMKQLGVLNVNSFEYYLCGPEQMIMDSKDYLVSKGVKEDKVKFELFTASTTTSEVEIETDFEESKIHIVIDDDDFEYTFNMSKSDNILEEGINQGLDLPYSCKGGVCCTCRAKVLEGSAKMKMNYALTEGEVEDGYILTCQSVPTSSIIKVSFDD